MKKITFFFFIISSVTIPCVKAQTNTGHNQPRALVGIDTILYLGYNNPLTVSTDQKDIICELSEGTIVKDSTTKWGNYYSVKVNKGTETLLKVYNAENGKKGMLLFTQIFLIKKTPELEASAGGLKGEFTIKKKILMGIKQIFVYNNKVFEAQGKTITINSFEMHMVTKKGNRQSFKSLSNKFTPQMMEGIANLDNESFVKIESVTATISTQTTSETQLLRGLYIKVVE